MERKYKKRVKRRYDVNRLGVEFGGGVTLVRWFNLGAHRPQDNLYWLPSNVFG